MSKLTKSVSPETLQAWGVDPSAQIEYYDGTILVIDDAEPEGGIGLMVKAGTAALFGVAVFSNAPLVGATMFLYAGYKVMATVKSLYGGSNSLTSRIEADLKVEPVPDGWTKMPQLPESEPVRIVTQLGEQSAINVPSQSSEPFAIPIATPESKLFDWNQLNSAYDDFPHLLLLGKTGAGKSFLAERMGRFLTGSTIVITPKKKPKDFIGMQVIGVPYDFRTIAANITGLSEIVKQREAEMNQTGKDDFSPVNVILDEVPTFVAGCKDIGFDVVKDLKFIIRAGRTSKVRLILLAQGQEVKTLGIEGEGSLRDNLSYIYLKGFAEPEAQRLRLDISKYDRPCLIDSKVADIAALVALSPDPTPQQVVGHQPTATPQDLERMYNAPSAEHEAEESVSEVESSQPLIKQAFPNWKQKSIEVAASIVDWLAARSDKSFAPSEIRKSIRRLKDDPSLPTERLKLALNSLVSAQILIESDGKYSIAPAIPNTNDDYDF
ncbi:MAG: type IV secretory system conjugative DNA transfer family protein [Phormidium tanganyikae FI6-MK23]|jgi:hypothetical protein|nr:type IV secretory system conjugative DNA transfer family protein [Phormidium tanganyikae FI6-MK23]